MAAIKSILFVVVALFALAASVPLPEPGGWGGKHEHFVIHVPYNVHHVHHHHVKKIHVPIIKEHVVVKEVHHEPHIHAHHLEHFDHHAPWW